MSTTDAAEAAMDALDDDITHDFEVGDWVLIYNTIGPKKRPILEGRGEIKIVNQQPEFYTLRMESGEMVERRALPGQCQTDPEAYLADVIAKWEAQNPEEVHASKGSTVAPEMVLPAASEDEAEADDPNVGADIVAEASDAGPEPVAPGPKVRDIGGNLVEVAADHPMVFDGILYPNKTRLKEAKRIAETKRETAAATPAPQVDAAAAEEIQVAHSKAAEAKKRAPKAAKAEKATPAPEPAPPAAEQPKKAPKAAKAAKPAPAPTPAPEVQAKAEPIERTGTKQEQVTNMLLRPEGATAAQIGTETGWQAHSTRGFIAGNFKKRGYTVRAEKINGVTTYFGNKPA